MIDRQQLLQDLRDLLGRLEFDLLERSTSSEVPEVGERLRAEYERARQHERTGQNYEDWRKDYLTQAAAGWVLSCVFVRFLEDNRLIDPPKIAGPGERLQRARDEHEIYFHEHRKQTDRDYLLAVFDELARLPGTKDIFGEHNPIRELPNWLSGDAAGDLLRFFQKIDANTGLLIHDFTDPEWDTRFLGDLYQDLSEAARKKYALLQTPQFVEQFILDRTLKPALDEFGLSGFKMLDPACGSGHFLLGAFRRLAERWEQADLDARCRDIVQRALDSIYGVDVNPYAAAIARFCLLLEALRTCGVLKLANAPAFRLNVFCGDSLLHGGGEQLSFGWQDYEHAYHGEDLPRLRQVLRPGTYHAVVANPPYITPKDRALNQEYRRRYTTCHMKYSLAVPFMQRIFNLAVEGGYTGQITANSFMKREFGKKLIEEFLPKIDLTHVIDTSGAYIPGHGTPTVILFGRNRKPVTDTIRTVMGIRGEPSTPDDPARGLVWSAILRQIGEPGSQSEFVSVGDSPRELFGNHPWSIGGGGAAELKEQLDQCAAETLNARCESIGFASFTGQDEAFVGNEMSLRRARIPDHYIKQFIVGDTVRDWAVDISDYAFVPYEAQFEPIDFEEDEPWAHWIWPMRTAIGAVLSFGGKTRIECGDHWWTWYRWIPEKYRTPLSIVYGEVATHNHFVLDRGGKVFNRTAPVIKLPADATEDDHLALLGLLNSSTACFWLKQVCFPKGGDHVGQEGARVRRSLWDERYAFNATNLQQFPVPEGRPTQLARRLDQLAHELAANSPQGAIARWQAQPGLMREQSLRQVLDDAYVCSVLIRGEMILTQEDLDWQCYRLYGLIDEDVIVDLQPDDERRSIVPGMRAFEVLVARDLTAGKTQTTWFERHGIPLRTELPDADFNPKYREIAERRIEIIRTNPQIALIEQPEYKRRWYEDVWGNQREEALREWLLNRLESYFDFDGRMNGEGKPTAEVEIGLISVARLADIADYDSEFQEVGAALKGDIGFDVQRLVAELVEAESVPLLPVLRYKPSGLRKRAEWEKTWDLQRREDAGKPVGPIPVPPKYTSADFLKNDYWRLRGKLDVPKERWVSFPHCEGADGTLVIAWAGYNPLQLAQAISGYYVEVQEHLGGRDDPRLVPLLGCLAELLPWIKQWQNAPDPAFDGMRMGDYFEGFLNEEARQLGLTIPEIKDWQPPQTARGRRRRAAK